MLHRTPMLSRLAAALAAALIGAASPAWAAPADDLRDAQKLYGQGKVQPAMDKVDQFLKAQPRDPQGRFLKGLLLTEQHRTDDAIKVFTGLTEDYPELPEPYNNLAVLYASQGNYDKAKSALELAIHTHPSYATAHENLGDIYAQLASRAYDRALQLDKNNATAQTKLAMVKELFGSQRTAASAEDCQKLESLVPDAAPAVNALARTIAVCGFSHPRIGDQRVADGMPGASLCGSKTATGPTFARACRAAVRLSGRVEVEMTAPGAFKMALMTMCTPLPERGGPSRTMESSTLA